MGCESGAVERKNAYAQVSHFIFFSAEINGCVNSAATIAKELWLGVCVCVKLGCIKRASKMEMMK